MGAIGRRTFLAAVLLPALGSMALAHGAYIRGNDISGNFAMTAAEPALNGTFAMLQVGYSVTGSIEGTEGRTVVYGKLLQGNPYHVWARWRGPAGESGWMTLNLNSVGTTIAGRYGDDRSHAEGEIRGALVDPQRVSE